MSVVEQGIGKGLKGARQFTINWAVQLSPIDKIALAADSKGKLVEKKKKIFFEFE